MRSQITKNIRLSSSPGLRVELEEAGVVRVIFDNPPAKNAMEWSIASEFRQLMSKLKKHPAEVVIFAGAGDIFSSGGGFGFFADLLKLKASARAGRLVRYYESFLSLLELPQITIAEVNGDAYGAAAGLILACDFRVCFAPAKVAFNFARIGLSHGMGTGLIGERLLGSQRLRQLLLLGESATGAQLEAWGVAWGVTNNREELSAKVRELVQELQAISPVARRQIKQALQVPPALLQAQLKREAAAQARAFAASDFQTWFAGRLTTAGKSQKIRGNKREELE